MPAPRMEIVPCASPRQLRTDAAQILILKYVDGECECGEIVDQQGVPETELLQLCLGNLPPAVGEAGRSRSHGACHRDGGRRRHLDRCALEIVVQRGAEGGEILIQVLALAHTPWRIPGRIHDRKACVGAADIADQNGAVCAQFGYFLRAGDWREPDRVRRRRSPPLRGCSSSGPVRPRSRSLPHRLRPAPTGDPA